MIDHATDIRWLGLHNCSFNLRTLWLNTTCCHALWIDPYSSENRRCVTVSLHYAALLCICRSVGHEMETILCIAGLYDTVFDVDNDKDRARSLGLEPNGFSFDGADSNGVDYALNRQVPFLN